MNKLLHLKLTKQYLRKVVSYRKNLVRMNAGKKPTGKMISAMVTIPYAISRIDNFDRMLNYISMQKVQQDIIELIPSNKPTWKAELENLIFEGNILAGKIAKQRELNF